MEELKSQAQVLQEAVDNHDPSQAKTDFASDQKLLAEHKTEIQRLEEAFEAKRQAETRDHYITRTAIPRALPGSCGGGRCSRAFSIELCM